jgi:hypothetical protein
MDNIFNKNGITVAELKRLIADWPETDTYGEPCEVWISTGYCLTSPCVAVGMLNYRKDEDMEWSDILFEVNQHLTKECL